MSFTGAGPLGTAYWGTSTSKALEDQAANIFSKYESLQQSLNSSTATKTFPAQPFPELTSVRKPNTNIIELQVDVDGLPSVWPAALFTANEVENLPADQRATMAMRKKEFSDQPKDIVDTTEVFRKAQLDSLQRRHSAIEALPAQQRANLHKLAAWIAAVIVNIRLRESLCYPLIRDNMGGGCDFYDKSLNTIDHLRDILRAIRLSIYKDPSSTGWHKSLGEAQKLWAEAWQAENTSWVPKLGDYLKHAQVDTLRDICATHNAPEIKEQNPPTSHDFNYGQQLSQMNEMLYLHMVRTGNMQGIPRPRHEADWACTDGFEPAYRPQYDEQGGFLGKLPTPTGRKDTQLIEDPFPQMSKELPGGKQANGDGLPYIGASLNRIVATPDAVTKRIREEFTALNEKRKAETVESIHEARMTKFKTSEAEAAAEASHMIEVARDRAVSLTEYLEGEKHTTDLEGSYYWNEVQLAFRNHGTHWETLTQDITPLGHHYLLIHYDVQFFKSTLESYRLKVFGCVTNPVELTLDQVKIMGKDHTHTLPMVMECSGNGRAMMKPRYNRHVPWGLQAFGCYIWTGIPLRLLLERVLPTTDCIDVVFTGYDAGLEAEKEVRYFSHALSIHDPVIDHSWLCWMNNGVDLLPEHGYPLRLMVPAWYGNANIKWLRSIEFIPRKFKGVYQRTYSYTKTVSDNAIAVPSQELRPRAMVAPIGIPDFTTRKRTAVAGSHTFHGKCWVGGGHYRAVVMVDLSLDGGKTWLSCKLAPRIGIFAWANFSLTIDLPVGMYTVGVRATDNLGNRQTFSLDWNFASMQDDAIQLFELTVVDSLKVIE